MELKKYINKKAIFKTKEGVFKANVLFVRKNIISAKLLTDLNANFKKKQIVRIKSSEILELEVFNNSNKSIYKYKKIC